MFDKQRYVVREVPFARGSRRRVLHRCTFLHEAMTVAETASTEGRCIVVELCGVQAAMWLNGRRVPPSAPAAAG